MHRIMAGLLLFVGFAASVPAADPPAHEGWAGPRAVADLAKWSTQQPPFELLGPDRTPVWQDNETANVRLWKLVATAGGEYPEPGYQETGDCTAWGGCHAIVSTQGGQAARGDRVTIKRLRPDFLYGAGRVWVWSKQIVGGRNALPAAGCSGAAIARAAQEYGVVPIDTPGLPPYSGAQADQWGREGPPDWLKEVAAKHKVRTVAQLRTVDQVRDAVCNYYGVAVASDWGNPRALYDRQDGRWVARRTGQWMHQMCIDGYDGSAASGKRYFHLTNSWPKSKHPAPIDDSPAGGFWVEDREVEYMLRSNDCYAYSDFEGFPAQNKGLDLSPLRPRPRPAGAPAVRPNPRAIVSDPKGLSV